MLAVAFGALPSRSIRNVPQFSLSLVIKAAFHKSGFTDP
jgi:hypothetical protein